MKTIYSRAAASEIIDIVHVLREYVTRQEVIF